MHISSPLPATQGEYRSQSQDKRPRRLNPWEFLVGVFGLIWVLIAFYPLLTMLLTSFRSQNGFYLDNPWLPPAHPTMDNYTNVWDSNFLQYLLNSLIVTIGSIVVILVVSVLAAYGIARLRSRSTYFFFGILLIGLAIPVQSTIIPLYIMANFLGIYDTLLALILPSVAFGIPMTVLILVTFMRDIPKELYQSMLIDGAGHRAILWRLVLPLSRPALITVTIYQAIAVWNGFLFPLVLTQSDSNRVLPLALWNFQGQYGANIPAIMAAVLLSAAPILLLYIFGRRYLLGGLTAGFSK